MNPNKAEEYRLKEAKKSKEEKEFKKNVVKKTSEDLQKQELCKKLRERWITAFPSWKLETLQKKVDSLNQ